MFCPNCGKEMNEGAEFCSNCGYSKNGIRNNKEKKINTKYLVVTIIGLIIIFIIGGIIFNIGSKSDISDLKYKFDNTKTVSEYANDTLVYEMDTVSFGSYKQDKIFFKEPIEWLVLDKKDDKVLLLSKKILESRCVDETGGNVKWDVCSLRKWLNNDFYNHAFNNAEKRVILNAHLKNEYDEYEVNDKVFILSEVDIMNYIGKGINDSEGIKFPKKVSTYGTKHAEASSFGRNKDLWYDKFSQFWLRDKGEAIEVAGVRLNDVFKYISFDGHRYNNGLSSINRLGVRPAMWVDISQFDSNSNKQNGWSGDYYYKNGQVVRNDWKEYNGKWYYLKEDGKYVRNDWKKIGDDYYYFDNDGAMKENAWINNEYFVGVDGKMLKNAITPDGYYVGEDGKYIDLNALSIANGKPIANKSGSGNYASELIEIYNGTYFGIKINTCKFDNEGRLWVHDAQAESAYHSNTAGYAEIYKIYTTKDNYIEYKLTYSDMRWGMYENDNYYKNDKKITETEFINIRNTFDTMQDMCK